jgi:AcrR family transcriptional regulator
MGRTVHTDWSIFGWVGRFGKEVLVIAGAGSSKRDVLIETALRLFEAEGFRAVGIDRILAEAGVAKMTLYNHFRTKDELILAAIRRRDERFRNWLVREVEKRAAGPRERLLAIFDALGAWFARPEFSGCPFLRVCSEFEDEAHPVRAAAREYCAMMRAYVTGLAREAGARDAEGVAEQILVLTTGATARAKMGEGPRAAEVAKRAAESVLAAAGVGEKAQS